MRMKTLGIGLAFVATAALGFAAGTAATKQGVMWAPSEEKWVPLTKDSPLTKVALWGDRDTGPEYGMLLKLPAGAHAGMHSHTADYYAIAVQGNWVHTFAGGQPKELAPGSYVFQPGKQVHDDECKGTTDCIVFIHQHGKGDFIPAAPAAGAPAKKP